MKLYVENAITVVDIAMKYPHFVYIVINYIIDI